MRAGRQTAVRLDPNDPMEHTSISNLLIQVPGLLKGLSVRGQNGKCFGHVVAIGQTGLEIERGILERHYSYLDYTEITSAFAGSIYVPRGRDALLPLPRRFTSIELDLIAGAVRPRGISSAAQIAGVA